MAATDRAKFAAISFSWSTKNRNSGSSSFSEPF
jgi:hypothetical protein